MKTSTVMDIILRFITIIGLVVMAIMMYGAYEVNYSKEVFDAKCKDAGGIPLKATYHYDKIQKRIEYTCLSVNAVIDIE